jgi:hypothetical protein
MHPDVSVIGMFGIELEAARRQWIENYDEEDGSSAESFRVAYIRHMNSERASLKYELVK